MTIRIKRTYEPRSRGDGQRILVERLWPRGMKKASLEAEWRKSVAPSTALRQWFAHRVERWDEFRRRYRNELDANAAAWMPIVDAARRGTVTLLYSAHDVEHNGAVVLRDYLTEQMTQALQTRKSKTSNRRNSHGNTTSTRTLGRESRER